MILLVRSEKAGLTNMSLMQAIYSNTLARTALSYVLEKLGHSMDNGFIFKVINIKDPGSTS